jgi:uncharacterized paraquat-inducible protein A
MTPKKTTCQAGHAFDEANTYVYRGKRVCRACKAARKAAKRAARPRCPHCGATLKPSAATVKMIVPVAAIVAEPQLARRCAA